MKKRREPCATCTKHGALRGSSTCMTCWKAWWERVQREAAEAATLKATEQT